jgi:hypothetical protein
MSKITPDDKEEIINHMRFLSGALAQIKESVEKYFPEGDRQGHTLHILSMVEGIPERCTTLVEQKKREQA